MRVGLGNHRTGAGGREDAVVASSPRCRYRRSADAAEFRQMEYLVSDDATSEHYWVHSFTFVAELAN